MFKNELFKTMGIYEDVGKKNVMYKVHRDGKRDTQAQVDFCNKAMDLILAHVEEGPKTNVNTNVTESTVSKADDKKFIIENAEYKKKILFNLSELIDILFNSKKFTITKNGNNKDIKWVKDVKSGTSAYANSKPTQGNLKMVPLAESFRDLLSWTLKQIAKADWEKNYDPSWGDVLRTQTSMVLLGSVIGDLLLNQDGPRNLIHTHGFSTAGDWNLVLSTYVSCNLTLLRGINICKMAGLITTWNPPKLADGKSGVDVKKAFDDAPNKYDCSVGLGQLLALVHDKKNNLSPTWETFVKWGTKVASGKLKENSVFWNPNVANEKGDREDELMANLNSIIATFNAITGSTIKDNFDWDTYYPISKTSGSNPLRSMENTMRLAKDCIVYSIESRPGSLTKNSSARSKAKGATALKGVSLI